MGTDLCTALYPAHLFEKVLGLGVFTVHGPPTDRRLVRTPLLAWYRILFCSALLCSVLGTILLIDILWPTRQKNAFYVYVTFYDSHSDFMLATVMILPIMRRRELLLDIWNRSLALDRRYPRARGERADRRVGVFCAAWAVLLCAMNLFLHVTDDNLVSEQKISYFEYANVVYCVLDFYKTSLGVALLGWFLSLGSRYGALADRLRDQGPSCVRESRDVHEELSWIARNVNAIYSPGLLVSLSMDFFVVTSQLYKFSKAVAGNELAFLQLALPLVWMAYFASDVVMLTMVGVFVTNQANKIKRRLLKMAVNTGGDQEAQQEIRAFSLQLLHDDVKITAGGFFNVDLSLMFTMIGAGTTYLVILIQFDRTLLKL